MSLPLLLLMGQQGQFKFILQARGLDQLLSLESRSYKLERNFLHQCVDTLIEREGYIHGPAMTVIPKELHATAKHLGLRPWWCSRYQKEPKDPYMSEKGIHMTNLRYVLRSAFTLKPDAPLSGFLIDEKIFYRHSLIMLNRIGLDYIPTEPTVFRRRDSLHP